MLADIAPCLRRSRVSPARAHAVINGAGRGLTPGQPGGLYPPTHLVAPTGTPAAAPSQLTGRKLLFIILGILAGCAVLLIGVLGVTALLGLKLFEAFR